MISPYMNSNERLDVKKPFKRVGIPKQTEDVL